MGKLTWYGVLGNHDYGGSNIECEFQYKKHGWRIDDWWWSYTMTVGTKTVAFVHFDTSYLAYGPNGEKSKIYMKPEFHK